MAALSLVACLAGCGRSADAPLAVTVDAPSWVLPGEYEPVERLLLGWDDGFEALLADMIGASKSYADITIVVDPLIGADSVRRRLAGRGVDSAGLRFVEETLELPWIRDFGPWVTRNSAGGRRIVDARYFQAGPEDDLPARLSAELGVAKVAAMSLEIEGGNVLSDGQGRCVTSAGYVDANEATSHSDPDTVRAELRWALGCRKLAIVPPLFGERTGHVDMLVTITGPGEAIVGRYDHERDPINAVRLDEAAALLGEAGFVVRRIPMPDNGDDVYRSYTNALALNGAVLIPVYDDDRRSEDEAFEVYRDAYPDRDLIAIESSEAIALDGAVHCLTMTVAR